MRGGGLIKEGLIRKSKCKGIIIAFSSFIDL